MKKIILFLLLIISVNVSAKVYQLDFTGDNREMFYLYNSQSRHDGIKVAEGDRVYKKSFNSVFIDFEKEIYRDSNISFHKDSVFGEYSGLFYDPKSYLRFKFETKFDFGMVLEFWVKPFTAESGTILSTEYLSTDGVSRYLEIFFKAGKIHYKFQNLFVDEKMPPNTKSVEISSLKHVSLKEWHHYRLTYNPANGLINLYIDGQLEKQVWATKDGNPGTSIMYLQIPEKWYYVIGRGFRGFIDNFFLSPDLSNKFEISIHDRKRGFIQSRALNLKSLVSIYDIDVNKKLLTDTSVTLQYRASVNPFSDNTSSKIITWKDYNLVNYQENPSIKCKYIQFRIIMFPSPEGKFSPLVKSLKLKYNKVDIPSIPLGLFAFSTQKKVILSFRESLNKNIVAYKIYYGKKKGQYWGRSALQGVSPVLVPITELEKNNNNARLYYELKSLMLNKVYYIRITALTDEGLESEMSKEVSVRVRKLK